MEEEKNESGLGVNEWLKDNLRIIVSVIIVIAIAGGIYSYSKRTQPTMNNNLATIESLSGDKESAVEVGGEEGEVAGSETKATEKADQQAQKEAAEENTQATSKETQSSFVEAAGRGDGVTHLARRALANYLEKNTDSSLTAEHKIYIEDYLRKHTGFTGRVFVGTSVEFDKDLIQQAINASKNLNEGQLNNLHKYAQMVPSLS